MIPRSILAGLLTLAVALPTTRGQEALLPPGDKTPVLQLDVVGPTADVTALAFDKKGTTLYTAGLDKVVRVYTLQGDAFVYRKTYRVPIGPGVAGSLNALAVSDDGNWLAVGGRELMRGESSFGGPGVFVSNDLLPRAMFLDGGNIYLINLKDDVGGKVLRGHCGEVQGLTFLPGARDKAPLLVSAGLERDGKQVTGTVRLWDVVKGEQVKVLKDMPGSRAFVGLVGWYAAGKVRIAIAWPEKDPDPKKFPTARLRVWDPDSGEGAMRFKSGEQVGPLVDLGGGRIVSGYLNGPTLKDWHGVVALSRVYGGPAIRTVT